MRDSALRPNRTRAGAPLAWALCFGPGDVRTERPQRELAQAIVVVDDDACGDADSLAAHASAWLGTHTIDHSISIEVRGSGFRIWTASELRGERTLVLDGMDCADRQAALGLAIAFAIDASVLGTIALVEPTLPEPQVARSSVPSAPRPGPRARARAVRGAVAAHAVAAFWVLPRPSFGADVSAEIGPAPWLDVVFSGLAMRGLDAGLGSGEVRAWLGVASVAVCPRRQFRRASARLCGGLAAGGVRGAGAGYRNEHTVLLPYLAILLGVGARVPLIPHLALDFEVRTYAPAIRTRFEALQGGVAFHLGLPPLGVLAAVGLAFTFP